MQELKLPICDEAIRSLRCGEQVSLSGEVLTGRDKACSRLYEMIRSAEPLPVELSGELMYFVGPTPGRDGRPVGAAGPTTASRMNAFLPTLMDAGLKGFIGKGVLSDEVKGALVRTQSVYFGAIGGAGALLSESIVKAEVVAFKELLSEAIHRFTFLEFPAVVLCDCHGGDLYDRWRKRDNQAETSQ